MPSNSFQTNLDTAINPSNNYIANALKPNISPGDKCSKIIPTSFKDTILSANTTSSSGQYNKKKITGKTERPHVWTPPNPRWRWKSWPYNACGRWCRKLRWYWSWWSWRSVFPVIFFLLY